MTIVEIQESVIDTLTDYGFQNVRDSLLLGLTQSEKYPVVVVDLEFSMLYQTARGGYTPYAHFLSISIYQKASIGIAEARQSASESLDDALNTLGLSIFNDKIMYKDTVLNNIKVCCAYAIVECSSYVENTYKPNLGISSSIDDCTVLFNGEETQYITPCVIKKANSGTYTVEKEGYYFSNIVVDLSDRKDTSIHFQHNYGQLNSPTIVFNEDDGKCYITTDISVDKIYYSFDLGGIEYEYTEPFYIDNCSIYAYCEKENYIDSEISALEDIIVPFVKIVGAKLDVQSRLRFGLTDSIFFTCSGGILISITNGSGYTNSIFVTSGATKYVYIKVIDNTIPGYVYCGSGYIDRLGASSTSIGSTTGIYQDGDGVASNDIGNAYIYLSKINKPLFNYINVHTTYNTYQYICGDIPDILTALLIQGNAVMKITKPMPSTLAYILLLYCAYLDCAYIESPVPSALKYIRMENASFYKRVYGTLNSGFYQSVISYINSTIFEFDVSQVIGFRYIQAAYSFINYMGNCVLASNMTFLYVLAGSTRFQSTSIMPASITYIYVNSSNANWLNTNFSQGTTVITTFSLINWRLSKFDKDEMVAILNSMATRVGRFPATCTIGQYIKYNAPDPEVIAAIAALKAAHKEITTVTLVV